MPLTWKPRLAAPDETVLRLFVSSPGDVQAERERVDLVVELLNAEFKGRARIETIRWETSFYSSHDTFQRQIPEAAECDAVVAIFGARLGSQLPPSFPPMPSGEPYPSGTAYEVLSAMDARRHGHGSPDIYVFRRPRAPAVSIDASDYDEILRQWTRLKQFFDQWFLTKSGEFLAAFQLFSSTDEFAGKIEACLRQWLARRGFAARENVWDRVRFGSPFPGLAAFDEARRDVFFGRELVVAQALSRLRRAGEPDPQQPRAPFLLVIGASGSGKSSLLRAALLPRLVQPGAVPEVDCWRKCVVSPDLDPFADLAKSLFADGALGPELASGAFRTPEILARQLAGDVEVAIAPLQEALTKVAAARQREARYDEPRPARLALVVDQAERLLIETEPALAARFAALLAALARRGVAYVLVALRSDAYARLQSVEAFVALRDEGATIDVLPPTPAELEEIVARPVAACDPPLVFEHQAGVSLAARLVADAEGGDALPLLQMSLARLYAAEAPRKDGVLRFIDYKGLGAAVTETANEALSTLDPQAQAQLPALVTGLIRDVVADPATGEPAPVIAALDRPAFEAKNPARRALIDAFVEKRLLTTEGDAESQRVRPVHESLLRIWPQAQAIVRETGDLIRVRHTLGPIVREWAASAEADRARHLDVSPALLSGAQRLVERLGDDVPADMRAFISQSSAAAEARRAREREEQERRVRDAEALAAANRRTAQRTGVGLAAALVLVALAGWQWWAADQAKREAEAQRARAEHNLALATDTAGKLVFDVAQRFRGKTGMPAALVKDVLESARALEEQLFKSGETSAELKSNHAAAMAEIGWTLQALGDLNGALALMRQARPIFAELAATFPSEVKYVANLSLTDKTIGECLQAQGDLDGAMTSYRSALATIEAALTRGVTRPDLLSGEDGVLQQIGDLQKQQGAYDDALASFRRGLAIVDALVAKDPANVILGNEQAVDNRHIGDVYLAEGNLEAAVASYAVADAISERLARENPDDTHLQRDFAVSKERLGEILMAKRDFAGALKAYVDGEAISQALADKDPTNLDWQDDLAIGDYEIGDAKLRLKDFPGAISAYRGAAAIEDRLLARDPTNDQWRNHGWIAETDLAEALIRHGEPEEAVAEYRRALALAEDALAQNPGSEKWRQNVKWTQTSLGDALVAFERYPDALEAYRAAVDMARKVAADRPEPAGAEGDLATDLGKLASMLAATGKREEAVDAYIEAVGILRKLMADAPRDAAVRGNLCEALIALGHLQAAAGRIDEAAADFDEAAKLAAALEAEAPDNVEWARDQARALEGLADALRDKGDAANAVQRYRESLAISAPMLKRHSDDANLRVQVAMDEEALGLLLFAAKDFLGAADAYRAAIDARAAEVKADPSGWQTRRTQMIDETALGDCLASAKDYAGALAAYQAGLVLARGLMPESADAFARSDLVSLLAAIGRMSAPLGQPKDAAAALTEALPLAEQLAAAEPSSAPRLRTLWQIAAYLGDARLALADRSGALEAYVAARDAATSLTHMLNVSPDPQPLLKLTVTKIGILASAMVAAGDYEAALKALDQATPVAPDQNWLDLVRANALTLLDRPDEARPLYLKHRGETSLNGKLWEDLVRLAFAELRAKGLGRPLMDAIEKTFAPPP